MVLLVETRCLISAGFFFEMGIESRYQYRFRFLRSEGWRGLRLHALARASAACRICGYADWSNDAHHRHYNEPWNKTEVEPLVSICRKCHTLVHKMMVKFPSQTSSEIISMVISDRHKFGLIVSDAARGGGCSLQKRNFLIVKSNEKTYLKWHPEYEKS